MLHATRVRRLTASFGLAAPAALAAAGAAIVALAPAAHAAPTHHRDRSSDSEETVRVRVDTAHLRSGPSEDRHSSGLLDEGDTAVVIDREGDWAKIRTSSGSRGWVRADLLAASKRKKKADSDDRDEDSDSRRARRRRDSDDEQQQPRRVAKAKAPAVKKTVVAKAVPAAAKKRVAVAVAKPAPVKPVAAPRPAVAAATVKTETPTASSTVASAAATAPLAARAAVPALSAPALSPPVVAAPTVTAAAPAATLAAREPETVTATQVASSGSAAMVMDSPTATMTITDAHIELKAGGEPAAADPAQTPAKAVAAATAAATAPKKKPVQVAKASIDRRALTRGDRVVRSALSYRGTPYRMGATGRGAFDCSGFTMYLFDKQGTELPRTAQEQFERGQHIAKEDLMPGDLVFFKNTYKHGISHVGIYIGNGQFCHAANRRDGVKTSSLSEPFYAAHYAGARRPR